MFPMGDNSPPGIVPVTLVNSRRALEERQSATHAEYSGMVEFHNVFEGELPAVEYPKINVSTDDCGPCLQALMSSST